MVGSTTQEQAVSEAIIDGQFSCKRSALDIGPQS